jgi:carbon monoxide dehydrogenase subunit G
MRSEKILFLPAAPEEAWPHVTDLAVLAECLPGARLESVDADGRAHGRMSVRVGAIVTNFEGKACISRRDDDARTLEVTAEGAGSHGRAKALITAELRPEAAGSELRLAVSVDIAGQLARLGQGMAEPVVDRLVERFGVALSDRLSAGPDADARPAAAPGPGAPADVSADALDLGALLALPPAARRGAVVTVLALAALVLVRFARRPFPTPTVIVYACGHGDGRAEERSSRPPA